MISSVCLIIIDEPEKLNKDRWHLVVFYSLRSSSSSEWVHFLYLMLSIDTNSICSAPDASNDKSKNEQIKSMLRVIDRIAIRNSPVLSYLKHVLKTDISLLFHSIQITNMKIFFSSSYYITLIIIYRYFFIQLSIVHILIKWIEKNEWSISDFYQSCHALYRNNRAITKC